MYALIQQVIDLNESFMWLWIYILLSVFLMIIMVLRSKSGRRRLLAKRIPGPKESFLVGSISQVIQGPEKIFTNIYKLYREFEKKTPVFKIWLCNNLYIFLMRPEDIEFVLTNPKLLRKSKEYVVLQESLMGQGIFSTDDIKKWKKNRKIVSGGVSYAILKSFIPTFYKEAKVVNDKLQNECDSNTNDCKIIGTIGKATMEMIGQTALGVKFNAQNEKNEHRFIENLQTALHTWEYRIAHPWYLSKTLFKFSSVCKEHDRSHKIINEFADEIINKRFDELNRMNYDNKIVMENDEDEHKNPKTLIEILLRNHHKMSHEQIREELITVMIGGQETTSFVNSSTIYMLAHHQDVQKRVFDELHAIFSVGDYHRMPTFNDLQQMEYLERTIKETLRLFPPLPIFGRRLDEEMTIGNHLLPADSTLLISPLFMQTSSQFYNDPKRYDPDHFLPDACHARHPYTYIPFSAGYRNCIGQKYAMLQMKTVISTLVRRSKFYPSDKCPAPRHLRLMFLTTLKFVDDLYVKIEPRVVA